jgi:hypothetical protein
VQNGTITARIQLCRGMAFANSVLLVQHDFNGVTDQDMTM